MIVQEEFDRGKSVAEVAKASNTDPVDLLRSARDLQIPICKFIERFGCWVELPRSLIRGIINSGSLNSAVVASAFGNQYLLDEEILLPDGQKAKLLLNERRFNGISRIQFSETASVTLIPKPILKPRSRKGKIEKRKLKDRNDKRRDKNRSGLKQFVKENPSKFHADGKLLINKIVTEFKKLSESELKVLGLSTRERFGGTTLRKTIEENKRYFPKRRSIGLKKPSLEKTQDSHP